MQALKHHCLILAIIFSVADVGFAQQETATTPPVAEKEGQTKPNPKLGNEAEHPEVNSLPQTPTDETSSDALTVEQLETALKGVREQLVAAQDAVSDQRDSEQAVDQGELRNRVALLQDLENAIERRITSLERLEQVRKTVAGLEDQVDDTGQVQMDTQPPFEIAMLDSLRDELDTARREAEAELLSQKTSETAMKQAEQRLEEAERKRREVRDQLEQLADEATRSSVERQLDSAQLSEQIAEQELASARLQLELSQLEHRSTELRIDLLEAEIRYVAEHVRFTVAEKTKRLTELDDRRSSLERELRNLRRVDQVNQAQLDEARQALARAEGEEETRRLAEALAAKEAVAESSNRGIELIQERINNLATFKTLWERRFAVTDNPSEEELATWQRETDDTLDEIQRRREQTEQRLQTLRMTKLDIENRLSSWNTAMGEKTDAQSRLSALQDGEQRATEYLASLLNLQQLARRVADDIRKARQLDSWRKYWSRFLYAVQLNWGREVFTIHDQAFRLGQLIWSVAVFLLVLLAGRVGRVAIRRVLLRRLRASAETQDVLLGDSLLAVARQTKPMFFVFLAAYLALITLPLSDAMRGILNSAAVILATVQVAIWGNAALRGIIDRTKRRRVEEDPSAASAFGLMGFFSQVAIWSAALLLILTNLGYEIGPLLAGLGVGGVAVAFALQSILGDIFCSIAIVLDKPFVIGDFIIVNDLMGTVENIGIKTTRIRSLSGEQIIFSNADLIGSRVRNYKRMYERRVVFAFGVVYETPLEQLEQISTIVRTIVEETAQTRFDRAHFKQYGDFSLDFEVVYYVLAPDYNLYMDIQQTINLRLFAAFQERGIAFAYPTREIIMRPSP